MLKSGNRERLTNSAS